MPENKSICFKCGKIQYGILLEIIKKKGYCYVCYLELIKKMSRKELEKRIRDIKYNGHSTNRFEEEDWKALNCALEIKNTKRFRKVEIITIISVIITSIAVVLALFKP